MKKIILCSIVLLSLASMSGVKANCTITSNFNSTSIPAGKKIWFNAIVRVSGWATYPLAIYFTNQTISSSAFTYTPPNAELILDPTVFYASTVFNGTTWVTTAPPNWYGNYFIGGFTDSLTSSIPGGLSSVSWTGTITASRSGVSVCWQWAASVFNSFTTSLNDLGVKPSDYWFCWSFFNADNACTPENYKSVTGGGTGDGSTYTGNYSSSGCTTPALANFNTAICAGATTTIYPSTASGTWSSSNTAVATVGTNGVVTGVSAGVASITFSSWNTTVTTITVNPLPSAGTISGSSSVCTGVTTTLTDATSGGSWSSSNTTVATAGSTGIVSGASAGAATISYTTTNTCGSASATKSITVNTTASAGTVSSGSSVCAGSTTTLTDGTSGGSWSSSNTTVATVGSTGIVTGASAGSATISYTATTTCGTASATKAITVNATPSAGFISGSSIACAGSTITYPQLTESVSGGVWSSSNTAVATVGSTGIVTGVSIGSVTITYTATTACGSATATQAMTINTTPTVTGTVTNVACEGNSNGSISTSISAGTAEWSTGATTTWGVINVAAGTYSVTATANGCSSLTSFTVTQPGPISITSYTITPTIAGINGVIIISPTGGTSPYSFLWTTGTGISIPTNVPIVTALTSGEYYVTVTDHNGCNNTFGGYTVGTGSGARIGAPGVSPSSTSSAIAGATAYPNPFTSAATIKFSLPADGHATVEVFNAVTGLKTGTVFNDDTKAGIEYTCELSGENLPSGMYIYKVSSENSSFIGKVTLVK